MTSTNTEVPSATISHPSENQTGDVDTNSAFSEADEGESTIPAIEFRHVHFSFEDKKVLEDISFKVMKGEIKIILSGSGGGKSTILKLVLGLLKPDEGRIFIDGEEITGCDETDMERVRQKIGMVFQEGALFDSLSVYDNIAYRLHEQGVAEDEVEREVRLLLRFVNLEDEIEKMPIELSGGMRTRVGIARALIGDPQIILFDEPTAGLDPPTARTICELVIRLRDLEDVASIFVTHEIENLKFLASGYAVVGDKGEVTIIEDDERLCLTNTKVLMLRDRRVIFEGTTEELFESEDPYIYKFVRGEEMDE